MSLVEKLIAVDSVLYRILWRWPCKGLAWVCGGDTWRRTLARACEFAVPAAWVLLSMEKLRDGRTAGAVFNGLVVLVSYGQTRRINKDAEAVERHVGDLVPIELYAIAPVRAIFTLSLLVYVATFATGGVSAGSWALVISEAAWLTSLYAAHVNPPGSSLPGWLRSFFRQKELAM